MKTASIAEDEPGIIISVVCIAHCLAEPCLKMLSISVPWNHSEPTRVILAGWIIFLGIAAIAQKELRHCNLGIRLLMIPGMLLVLAAAIGGLFHMPEFQEILVCTVGNILVILAHQQNRRLIVAHDALACIAEDEYSTPAGSEQYCI